MERHSKFQCTSLGVWLEFGKYLANVFAFRGKHFGSLRVSRFVSEQVAIFFHVGSASRRIGDDSLDVRAFERLNRLLRQFDRRRFLARVHQQRPAARLLARRHNFASFRRQNSRRGRIHLRKKFPLHATQKQANPPPLRSLRRRDLRDCLSLPQLWQKRLHRLHFLRQQLQ